MDKILHHLRDRQDAINNKQAYDFLAAALSKPESVTTIPAQMALQGAGICQQMRLGHGKVLWAKEPFSLPEMIHDLRAVGLRLGRVATCCTYFVSYFAVQDKLGVAVSPTWRERERESAQPRPSNQTLKLSASCLASGN